MVTGSLSPNTSGGLSQIPVVVINQDQGEGGRELVRLFQSPALSDTLITTISTEFETARRMVDDNEMTAAILVPAGFSDSLIPDARTGEANPVTPLTLYANPSRPTSSGIVQSIIEHFLSELEAQVAGSQVVIAQLLGSNRIQPQQSAQIIQSLAAKEALPLPIQLEGLVEEQPAQEFNILAYMAPGMALMFLMFTVSNGGRSLLTEKSLGTLPRQLVAPLHMRQVLMGKMVGTFLTGLIQMLLLIITSAVLFQLSWGDPLAVFFLVIFAVFGAIGWGMLLTALVKTPAQAGSVGMAVLLIFGVLGGSFFDPRLLPEWFQVLSKITPNAWGVEGFTILAAGGSLVNILPNLLGLFVMGLVLFGISLFLFRRNGVIQA